MAIKAMPDPFTDSEESLRSLLNYYGVYQGCTIYFTASIALQTFLLLLSKML